MRYFILSFLVGFFLFNFLLDRIMVQVAPRKAPIHKGVDPELQPFVDEYIDLAAKEEVFFEKKVTLGLVKIEEKKVVGICFHGPKFREIDIDKEFWDDQTDTGKKAVIFHELTHCYCDRDHDYGDMKFYDIPSKLRGQTNWENRGKPGYMQDGCPLSIMYPIVLDDRCLDIHYDEYMKEMFERCEPW